MRGLAVLSLAGVLCGCDLSGATARNLPAPFPVTKIALHSWFPLASVRCRATGLTQRLEERPPRRRDVRVQRDVLTLGVRIECEREGRSVVDAESVLAQGVSIALVGPDGRLHAPRAAPTEKRDPSTDTAAVLQFELLRGEPLARARSVYDAQSGEPKHIGPEGLYTLRLTRNGERIEVRLRYAFDGPVLDQFMGSVIGALVRREALPTDAGDEQAARVQQVQAAFTELFARYRPRSLRVDALPLSDDRLDASITLTDLGRKFEAPAPLRIGLRLSFAQGALHIVDAVDPTPLRKFVECATLEAELAEALSLAAEIGPGVGQPDAECTLLDYRLPSVCSAVPLRLRQQVLRVSEQCDGAHFPEAAPKPVPADFLAVLRHGHKARGLGRDTRISLRVYGSGATVFQRGNAHDTRAEGLTSPGLVQRLYGLVEELAFLDRKGGAIDGKRCGPHAAEGDAVTISLRGRERTLVDYPGCRGAFSSEELTRLSLAIGAVGGLEGFTSPVRPQRDARVSVWTVSDE
jgi:hypothetical protein